MFILRNYKCKYSITSPNSRFDFDASRGVNKCLLADIRANIHIVLMIRFIADSPRLGSVINLNNTIKK